MKDENFIFFFNFLIKGFSKYPFKNPFLSIKKVFHLVPKVLS